MSSYYGRMVPAMLAAWDRGEYVDDLGRFRFSDWKRERYDPAHGRVRPLCVDGHAYRRRMRRRLHAS